jgi:SAM-dependent methyltransferase
VSDYVLGTDDAELARLAFQHEVWRAPTERLIERLELAPGARAADLGSGPGLALAELRARVGATGTLLAVDESERWGDVIRARAAQQGWGNVAFRRARLEELELEPGAWSGLFLRWVLSFLPDPGAVLARLAPALERGGAIAILDYNHEGLSLFPRSAGFQAVVRATRALYASRGGDLWIAGRLPGLLRAAGLEPEPPRVDVLCGGPDSPAFRWADAFFPQHSAGMLAAGLLEAHERELFLAEWAERRADPDALFFSPLQVSIVARKL